MSTVLELGMSGAAGALVGCAFFGGLWLTLRGLGSAPSPALRVALSMLLRFGATLGAFYLLARYAGSQHVVAAAVGFSVARLVVAGRAAPRSRGARA